MKPNPNHEQEMYKLGFYGKFSLMDVEVLLEYIVEELSLDLSVGDVECRAILLFVSFNVTYEECIYKFP